MHTRVCDGKIVALCQGAIFATVVREDLESLLQRICSQLTTDVPKSISV
jgi:hypothetical protein